MKITDHGYDRIDERVGLSGEASEKMAARAMELGISFDEATGQLKGYLTKLYLRHGKANNSRVYGEHVYLFCGDVLITVMHLPNNLKKVAAKIRRRKEG